MTLTHRPMGPSHRDCPGHDNMPLSLNLAREERLHKRVSLTGPGGHMRDEQRTGRVAQPLMEGHASPGPGATNA